jgi:hypothetical protein
MCSIVVDCVEGFVLGDLWAVMVGEAAWRYRNMEIFISDKPLAQTLYLENLEAGTVLSRGNLPTLDYDLWRPGAAPKLIGCRFRIPFCARACVR